MDACRRQRGPFGAARPPRRAAALAGALLLGVLAGCAGPEDAREQGLGILLPASERAYWERLGRAFEARRPGVRLRVVEGPDSTDAREDLYTAALLSGAPTFDLVYLDVPWTAKFAAAGWLVPLDEAFPPPERAEWLPAAADAGLWRGRLYRVPVRTDVGLVFLREDWLREAGLAMPQSPDDLRRVAERLQSPPERWGFVWQGKQYEGLVCAYLEVLTAYGGTWVDEDTGAVGLDRPEAVAALEFLRGCVAGRPISPPGVTTYQEEEARRLFHAGRAAILRSWPYVWGIEHAEGGPLAGRIAAMPFPATPAGRPACALGGWGIGVARSSPRKDDAIAFARFAVSEEGQRLLCAESGFAPARAASYEDPELLAANPFLPVVARAHRHAVRRPSVPQYALLSGVLQRALSKGVSGVAAPGEALAEAARETRLVLGRPKAGGP